MIALAVFDDRTLAAALTFYLTLPLTSSRVFDSFHPGFNCAVWIFTNLCKGLLFIIWPSARVGSLTYKWFFISLSKCGMSAKQNTL